MTDDFKIKEDPLISGREIDMEIEIGYDRAGLTYIGIANGVESAQIILNDAQVTEIVQHLAKGLL